MYVCVCVGTFDFSILLVCKLYDGPLRFSYAFIAQGFGEAERENSWDAIVRVDFF